MKPEKEQKKYIITENELKELMILYEVTSPSGYKMKRPQVLKNAILSRPYMTIEEEVGLLPVHGNTGFENMVINDDMTTKEILAYNRLKLKKYINEQREEATNAATIAERDRLLEELIKRFDEYVGSMEDCVVEMQDTKIINHTMNKIESFREVIGIIESLHKSSGDEQK